MSKKHAFRLYIIKEHPLSRIAIKNLREILEKTLKGRYTLEVIDVTENPRRAEEDRILAIPTLVRVSPPPVRKIIGDLSEKEKVMLYLDLLEEGEGWEQN